MAPALSNLGGTESFPTGMAIFKYTVYNYVSAVFTYSILTL